MFGKKTLFHIHINAEGDFLQDFLDIPFVGGLTLFFLDHR